MSRLGLPCLVLSTVLRLSCLVFLVLSCRVNLVSFSLAVSCLVSLVRLILSCLALSCLAFSRPLLFYLLGALLVNSFSEVNRRFDNKTVQNSHLVKKQKRNSPSLPPADFHSLRDGLVAW